MQNNINDMPMKDEKIINNVELILPERKVTKNISSNKLSKANEIFKIDL
jgi:hypothetical protein